VHAPTAESLAERLLRADRAALARLISWAENGDARFPAALDRVYSRVGRAARTGFTGPPGAGKSTLVNEVAKAYRGRGDTVGVLAVDPSSPFSGGALLGDRIRMEERTLDPGVFIRSMASRESHGGVAQATVDACDVMDAFGLAEILIETVGVGQAEYDVVAVADTVVVVLCPGAGDGIQAMKAGLLEVADVLVVNKSDLPGADRLARDLDEAVHVRFGREQAFPVPVVSLCASSGEGVAELLEAVDGHRAWLAARDLPAARLAKRAERVRKTVDAEVSLALWGRRGWGAFVAAELAAGLAPHRVASELGRRVSETLPPAPGAPESNFRGERA
jgi:LAO/AO transport system kinase